jgi:hypothetical protein
MTGLLRLIGPKRLGGILALALLALLPQCTGAAGICFRNELKSPVVVQGGTVVNGMLRRGQPLIVYPGRLAWDSRLPRGTRIVTIYDANQPARVLFRDTVEVTNQDQAFAVRQGPGNTIRLVPVPLPGP